jgi:hypothetical protein
MCTESIHFTQDGYSDKFKDGRDVKELANELKAGKDPRSIEPVKIVKWQGKIWSLDNRRLLAAHMAGTQVNVEWATQEEIDAKWTKHFTTENGGVFIERNADLRSGNGVMARFKAGVAVIMKKLGETFQGSTGSAGSGGLGGSGTGSSYGGSASYGGNSLLPPATIEQQRENDAGGEPEGEEPKE